MTTNPSLDPSITYLILTHNEPQAFDLIRFIRSNKSSTDKIIVLDDFSAPEFVRELKQMPCKVIQHKLAGDYAEHRNFALAHVKTDYIFALDADEKPHGYLMVNVKTALLAFRFPDILWIPRANHFEGVLPIHALLSGWILQDGLVQPWDPQPRVFRNRRGIKWVGKLHERIKIPPGSKVAQLPFEERYAIIHTKSIEAQMKSNEQYNRDFTPEQNSGEETLKLLKD